MIQQQINSKQDSPARTGYDVHQSKKLPRSCESESDLAGTGSHLQQAFTSYTVNTQICMVPYHDICI